jgi:ABC-type lipoprotein export system ATPase subunit
MPWWASTCCWDRPGRTLLNILGGLDHASSGTVRFRDHDLTRLDDSALTAYRRDHVGFVFQFYNLMNGRGSMWIPGRRT